jgi:hypothetical protein
VETSLHRQIKALYGSRPGGRVEVSVAGYRIDAICADGLLIEVQSGALGPLRGKIERLVGLGQRIRVVKPIILARRIVRLDRSSGRLLSARTSPKRGHVLDVFQDLVGVARWLTEPGFSLELLEVDIDERRVARKRRPGFAVVDRILVEAGRAISLEEPDDLWRLLPASSLPRVFTTRDLAQALGRPLHFAQQVAYCLRTSGAAQRCGRLGRFPGYTATANRDRGS